MALPICGMVSIIPRVDLLGNTVVDWICKLSYFRLDTLPMNMQMVEIVINSYDRDDQRTGGELIRQVLHTINVPVGKETDPITFSDSNLRKFSVVFSFKVVCAENYYSQDCARFCNESCTCDPGFTGEFCHEIDDCLDVNCGSNGQCLDRENAYACVCNPGFTGENCEINIDECGAMNIMCNSRGQCVDGVNNFTCDCDPGYTGKTCDVDIDECQAMNITCNERGQCFDFMNDFTCDCDPGFTGKACETNIDECLALGNSSCSGRGECVDGENDFICMCDPGFTGKACEVDMDACGTANCSSHGQCKSDYSCSCYPDYTGERCEVKICDLGITGPSCNQCK